MINQKNSFLSLMKQISLLNRNSVEIITKLNEVVSSQSSQVFVNYTKESGDVVQYNLPTIGYLKREIDIANNNIRRLAGIEGEGTYMIDGTTTKKVYTADLSVEPSPISTLNNVNTFTANNNWFFESLMNPVLSVNIDLSDKVDQAVNKALSRRYIVKFARYSTGELTPAGLTSLNDFKSKYLNKNNINIEDFLTWMKNPTNVGLETNDPSMNLDEQIFDFSQKEVMYSGYFSVLKMEEDFMNRKMWYHLNTITYYDKYGNSRMLGVNDEMTINKKGSTTRYKVKELSTASSNFRVVLERIEGYDPIPSGVDVLRYYSDLSQNKNVKITIGFDEYNVIFLKPINTDTNIVGNFWSEGMSFYSNDLILDTDSNVSMSDYYINSVYDYGTILKDMVAKKTPSSIGIVPNVPVLDATNFRVEQINKHLTDNPDAIVIKDLHSQKTDVKSKLEQINTAISKKSQEISKARFSSTAEKQKSENEVQSLIVQQQTHTSLLNSLVTQISAVKPPSTDRKYRVRGFWTIPSPQSRTGYKPQEIIQFEYRFRYSAKGGKENPTAAFNVAQQATTTSDPTVARSQSQTSTATAPKTIGGISEAPKTMTAYFSNWVSLKTDIRQRAYDEVTGQWYWKLEDISDADTPNINQLDLSITQNEVVEVQIRSISEVGWPDAPLFSDWSNSIKIEFPDDLAAIGNENTSILKEANNDSVANAVIADLNSKGLNNHLSDGFISGDHFFVHLDKNIATTFKDLNGTVINLYEYLKLLTERIGVLENQISQARGELKVYLYNNTSSIELSNNSSLNVTIECEDFSGLVRTGITSRSYVNNIYCIKDYYLKIQNDSSTNPLGLVSKNTYTYNNTYTYLKYNTDVVCYVDGNDTLNPQQNNQFIWFSDNSNGNKIYSGVTNEVSMNNALTSNYNVGLSNNTPLAMISGFAWAGAAAGELGATVHPYIQDINSLIERGQDKVKLMNGDGFINIPINIYFKFDVSSMVGAYYTPPISPTTITQLNKKLRIYIQPDRGSSSYEAELIFQIKQYKLVTYQTSPPALFS